MVTLRTYANPTEAGMAKSLLDNHNIFCRLADEDVNRYGGAPFAMPIRLLVAEDQAEEAARILETKGPDLPEDFDVGVDPNMPEDLIGRNGQILSEMRGLHHMNQWILLVSIIILVIVVYLVFELPHRTSPWSSVYRAVQRYDYRRALLLAKNIVREHPDDYYGHEYLGYIYLQMGDLNQAESEYSRAYELAPPKGLQEKLEYIRHRRDRQLHDQPSATPIPWP